MTTTVHLLRHGEVHNPTGILYGRRSGFQLSELGRQMGAYGPEVPVPDGATALDRLLGLVGRDPHWST